jgi:hypothetical protein
MKSLKDYLIESKQQYEYRIKIAGAFTDEFLEAFKKGLDKFDLVSLSKPKKTPVMKAPAGFPHLANEEISIMDAVFNYPASEQQIVELAHTLGFDPNMIRVFTPGYDDTVKAADGEVEQAPLLGTEPPKTNAAQKAAKDAYSNSYQDEVLKNAYKSKFEIAGGKPSKAVTTNDFPMGNESPIPGTNKIPAVKSSAR